MNRLTLFVCVVLMALLANGCSAKEEKEANQALSIEMAKLRADIKQLQAKQDDLTASAQRAALKASDDKVLIEETLKAANLRLIHQGLDQFSVKPAPINENGWLLVSGEHTYTLVGYPDASMVKFFWADSQAGLTPKLLGEDTIGTDGWSFTGTLPFSIGHVLWAEVGYPGGIRTTSTVLPLRTAGK